MSAQPDDIFNLLLAPRVDVPIPQQTVEYLEPADILMFAPKYEESLQKKRISLNEKFNNNPNNSLKISIPESLDSGG